MLTQVLKAELIVKIALIGIYINPCSSCRLWVPGSDIVYFYLLLRHQITCIFSYTCWAKALKSDRTIQMNYIRGTIYVPISCSPLETLLLMHVQTVHSYANFCFFIRMESFTLKDCSNSEHTLDVQPWQTSPGRISWHALGFCCHWKTLVMYTNILSVCLSNL